MVGISGLVDKNNELLNEFIDHTTQNPTKIYSFNFMTEITMDNFREAFFQTLSNSNWANEGYLVFHKIEETNQKFIRQEMKRLSAFYGIGTILLKVDNLEDTEVISLAEGRNKLDLNFINELISNDENVDFKNFIKNTNEAKKRNEIDLELFNNICVNKQLN